MEKEEAKEVIKIANKLSDLSTHLKRMIKFNERTVFIRDRALIITNIQDGDIAVILKKKGAAFLIEIAVVDGEELVPYKLAEDEFSYIDSMVMGPAVEELKTVGHIETTDGIVLSIYLHHILHHFGISIETTIMLVDNFYFDIKEY